MDIEKIIFPLQCATGEIIHFWGNAYTTVIDNFKFLWLNEVSKTLLKSDLKALLI